MWALPAMLSRGWTLAGPSCGGGIGSRLHFETIALAEWIGRVSVDEGN